MKTKLIPLLISVASCFASLQIYERCFVKDWLVEERKKGQDEGFARGLLFTNYFILPKNWSAEETLSVAQFPVNTDGTSTWYFTNQGGMRVRYFTNSPTPIEMKGIQAP